MRTFSEFLKIYRELSAQEKESSASAALKIALLSSFTVKGMKEILTVMCHDEGIPVKIYEGNYGQYAQEVYLDNSGLYAFAPDVAVFLLDLENICPDYLLNPYAYSLQQRTELIQKISEDMFTLLDTFTTKSKAVAVVNNFLTPTYSPLGLAESKQPFGFVKSIDRLNANLHTYFEKSNAITLFDFNQWAGWVGKNNVRDAKLYYQGDIKISFAMLPFLCENYMPYLRSLTGRVKKCLVLDLDNTLWGGIIGEDGIENIKLGLQYEGKAFYEFQKAVLALYNRGVILAINSKNNWEDVKQVFEKHPYMLLKESHFAAMQVNWQDKATNMKQIAKELNIGLDSFVFMDDDAVNCALIQQLLPQVETIHLPQDRTGYVACLQKVNHFDYLFLSEEDKEKGKMYAKQRERNDMLQTVGMDAYLQMLDTKLTVTDMNPMNTSRIAQLMQKTNQFNTTTRRYSQQHLERLRQEGYQILCAAVCDQFGDSGLCGVLVYKEEAEACSVDSMLLSCRVLGRGVEEAFLHVLACRIKAAVIRIEWIETNKNGQVKAFLEKMGFHAREEASGVWQWEIDKQKIKKVDTITVRDEM